MRAKIERKLARARAFVPAVNEIGALCDDVRETLAITINPLVTHTLLEDFKHKQETQLTQVAIPAMEAAQEKARKILERVVRDVADEAKAVSAAVAATGGIDSFVSKTKSMIALKRERHERAQTQARRGGTPDAPALVAWRTTCSPRRSWRWPTPTRGGCLTSSSAPTRNPRARSAFAWRSLRTIKPCSSPMSERCF